MTTIYSVSDTPFAKRLKEARRDKDLTLKQLADKVGLSEGNLSKYETGAITNIRLDNLREIAANLDVSEHWLLGQTEDKTVPPGDRLLYDTLYTGFDGSKYNDSPPLVLELPDDVLGSLLVAVVKDRRIRQIVLELSKLSDRQLDIALKMIKALQ